MFKFGDMVKIIDTGLKSYGKIGVVVGETNGCIKVYLKEKVGKPYASVAVVILSENKIVYYKEDTDELEELYKEYHKTIKQIEEIKEKIEKLEIQKIINFME